MAELGQLLADGDDVRLSDGGAYLVIEGDLKEAEPASAPTGLAYNRTTGELTWDSQNDATSFRIIGNDKTNGALGRRTRTIGTVNFPTLTMTDDALQDGESRSYEIRAVDDYTETLEGRPAVIFILANDRKL